jgi:hypothetical protein
MNEYQSNYFTSDRKQRKYTFKEAVKCVLLMRVVCLHFLFQTIDITRAPRELESRFRRVENWGGSRFGLR